jgi:DNA-binding NtrC family response regulator
LNVLPVHLPPLRDRREDIAELVQHFLDQAAAGGSGKRPDVSRSAMALLTDYDWPGNVRELENICRRAATLCTGSTIDAALVQPWLGTTEADAGGLGPLREGRMLEDMERHLIERVLHKHGGHRAKTAKALGMGVRTLGMKLKQWREEAEAMRRVELVEA